MAWPEEDGKTSIVNVFFEGVFGYELKNDSMGSVVLEFNEISLNKFLQKYGSDIKESFRQNGAYGPWASDLDSAESMLSRNGIKAIELSSSMGMEGWVLAKSVSEVNA